MSELIKKKRWVYLVYTPSDDGTTADVFAVFSSKKKALAEVNRFHSEGDLSVNWYRGVLL